MTDDIDIAKLRSLIEAADNWDAEASRPVDAPFLRDDIDVAHPWYHVRATDGNKYVACRYEEDAQFHAAARTLISRLLDALEQARKERDAAERMRIDATRREYSVSDRVTSLAIGLFGSDSFDEDDCEDGALEAIRDGVKRLTAERDALRQQLEAVTRERDEARELVDGHRHVRNAALSMETRAKRESADLLAAVQRESARVNEMTGVIAHLAGVLAEVHRATNIENARTFAELALANIEAWHADAWKPGPGDDAADWKPGHWRAKEGK